MSVKCNDPVVGRILAGWRYDISGLAAEMRGDYEDHFANCAHCKGKQRLHRTIDIGLIVVATISAGVFLVAFAAVRAISGWLLCSDRWARITTAAPPS